MVRFSCAGLYGKYICWPGEAWREGVTFTFCDEMLKMSKVRFLRRF